MSSKLIKNTSLYTIGNILPKVGSLIFLPLYTRYLSPEQYGIVTSMQVLITILQILFTFGLERSLYRIYYDYETQREKKELFGTITLFCISVSVLMILLIFLLKPYVGKIYRNIPFSPYYSYTLFISLFSSISLIPKIYFQIKQSAKKYIVLSSFQFILINIFACYYVVIKSAGPAGYLKGQLIAWFIQLPIYIYIYIKILSININKRYLSNSLRFSLPMIPILVSAWVLSMLDRIFIERFYSLDDVGIYSLAFKISSFIIIFASAFNRAYNPYFYKIANTFEYDIAKKKLSQTNTIYVIVVILSCFFVSLFSREIILLFDSRYISASIIIPMFMISYAFGYSTGVLNLSIYQNKKTEYLMYLMVISAIISIVLNYILIPKYGMIGAVYSKIISNIFLFSSEYLVARKFYYVPFKWKLIIFSVLSLFVINIIFIIINIENFHLLISLKVIAIFLILFIHLKLYTVELKSMLRIV